MMKMPFVLDYLIDMGPGAGIHGGHVITQRDTRKVFTCDKSITAQNMSGKRSIAIPTTRRALEKRGKQKKFYALLVQRPII